MNLEKWVSYIFPRLWVSHKKVLCLQNVCILNTLVLRQLNFYLPITTCYIYVARIIQALIIINNSVDLDYK